MAVNNKSQSFEEKSKDIDALVAEAIERDNTTAMGTMFDPANAADLPPLKSSFDLVNGELLTPDDAAQRRTLDAKQQEMEEVRGLFTGRLSEEQVSSVFARAAAKITGDKQRLEQERKTSHSTTLLLALLDQLDDQIRELEAQIADMEISFEALYGETWREDLAHEILDDVPQQRPGESLDDYRDRVEQAVLDEMIDPDTGKVKDEYKDHPDQRIRHIAQWAQKEAEFAKAKDNKEKLENGTPKEQQVVLDDLSSDVGKLGEAYITAEMMGDNQEMQVKVDNASDGARDAGANGQTANINGFLG